MFISGKKPSELTRGKWYFGPICRGCVKRLPIIEDTKRGARPFDVGDVMLRTTCPHCGADSHQYRPDEVQSFEHS
jgi:hypothetical protein